MFNNSFFSYPGATPEEISFLQNATSDLSENQLRGFHSIYMGKRKSQQDMLLFCILGLVLVPGIQRFIQGQIGMGLLYLFTIGLCFIGSIVDLVNYKSLAQEYNQKMAFESYQMAKMLPHS
jgi:TM2 domain-containing membrane protein YozV